MKAFWQMTLNEFRSSLRNIVFVIFTLITPLLMLFLFGGLYSDNPEASMRLFEGYDVVRYSFPAYVGLVLAIIAFTGMPQQLVSYKENKIFKRLKASPVKEWQIFLPIFINYLVLFLIGFILLLVCGVLFFGMTLSGSFFGFALALFLSVTALFSIGLLLSVLCQNVKQITAIGFTLLIPMVLLSGATMPVAAFNNQMIENIAQFVPVTQCVTFMRGMFLGLPFADFLPQLFILAGITAICSVLSVLLFKWE